MIKRTLIFMVSVLCLLAVVSCSRNNENASQKSDNVSSKNMIKLRDMSGREIVLSKKPDRIVCIGPGALRLISYMELESKVVGVEKLESKYPTGRPYWIAKKGVMGSLPAIGLGGVSNINNISSPEGLLKVKPDIVFASYLDRTKADEFQKKLSVPIVVLDYGKFASFDPVIYESLRLIGKIFGNSERAEQVVGFIKSKQADLKKRVVGIATKPSVYIAGLGFKGAHGIESTDASYVPFVWLGMNNVVDAMQKEGHLFVSREQLLKLNPDFIFIDGGGSSLIAQDYAKKPEFYRSLKAFKDGEVYSLFPFNWYTTNVGTAIVDAYAVGKIVYPQKFEDVDLKSMSDDVYKNLLGVGVYDEMVETYGKLGSHVEFPK